MPRINFEDSEKYGGSGYWFTLADDGDTVEVMVLLEDLESLPIYAIHQVELNGITTSVDCLRGPNDSIDKCPLCKNGHKATVQMYIPLLVGNQVKLWSRGKTFYSKIKSLFRRYPELYKHTFEVERIGEKGDNGTTYEFHFLSTDKSIGSLDTLLSELSQDEVEKLEVVGVAILDWSEDEMWEYVETGKDPRNTQAATKSKKPATPAFKPRTSRAAVENANRNIKETVNENNEDVDSDTIDAIEPKSARQPMRRDIRKRNSELSEDEEF